MTRVFVNYRRKDGGGQAGRLYDALRQHGEFDVFMDVDNIPIGSNFVVEIERALADCGLVLAVIGPHWLQVTDRHGRRRVDEATDHVRAELEAAMRLGITLVPILVGGAEMPDGNDLPPSLAPIVFLNAYELRDGPFHDDFNRLLQKLSLLDLTPIQDSAISEDGKARAEQQPDTIQGPATTRPGTFEYRLQKRRPPGNPPHLSLPDLPMTEAPVRKPALEATENAGRDESGSPAITGHSERTHHPSALVPANTPPVESSAGDSAAAVDGDEKPDHAETSSADVGTRATRKPVPARVTRDTRPIADRSRAASAGQSTADGSRVPKTLSMVILGVLVVIVGFFVLVVILSATEHGGSPPSAAQMRAAAAAWGLSSCGGDASSVLGLTCTKPRSPMSEFDVARCYSDYGVAHSKIKSTHGWLLYRSDDASADAADYVWKAAKGDICLESSQASREQSPQEFENWWTARAEQL